jgi:anti-anti-sigma regulatory factor
MERMGGRRHFMVDSLYHVRGEDGRIVLEGLITGAASGSLGDAYSTSGTGAEVVLDCAGIEHVDVFGLNELIKLWLRARAQGRVLRATGVSKELMDVFRATRTDGAFSPQPGTGPYSYSTQRASAWAEPVDRLNLTEVPEGAVNLNVDGLAVVGAVQGFGQLWEKTYRVRLAGSRTTPKEVIGALKEHFPSLQPPQNRFFPGSRGIVPGEVILINAHTPGGLISTGVWVVYSDEESFTFMTPQGHPESGWVSFSAFEEYGGTVAQVKGFARANDPVYEMAFRIVGSKEQERIWTHVLESLAQHFGVPGWVRMHKTCAGPDLQWAQAVNVWYNAQLRTMLSTLKKTFSS